MTLETDKARRRREAAERSRHRGETTTREEVARRACQACGRIPYYPDTPCPFCGANDPDQAA